MRSRSPSGGPGRTQLAGWVEILADDSEAAERELRWGFDKLSEIGEMSWFSTVAGILAEAVLANGRPEEARRLAEASRDAAAPDDVYSQVLWRTVASKVLAGTGTGNEAERLAREAVDLVSPTDFLHLRWHALLSLARVLSLLGRGADATEYAQQAAELRRPEGFPGRREARAGDGGTIRRRRWLARQPNVKQ